MAKSIYYKRKLASINAVQNAIDILKCEGKNQITNKDILELSGISNGTFHKEHIQEILKQNQVCKYDKSQFDQIFDGHYAGARALRANQIKMTTINIIQCAIDGLKFEHVKVTKKNLIEITGLSPGTFSADYVKEILKANQVCQYDPQNIARKKELKKIALSKEERLFEKEKYKDAEITRLRRINVQLNKELEEKNIEYDELLEMYNKLVACLSEHNID